MDKQKPAGACSHAGMGRVPDAGLSVTSRARDGIIANPSAPVPFPGSQRSGEGDARFLINTH